MDPEQAVIRCIGFDVGNVLLPLNYGPFLGFLLATGLMSDYRVYLLSNIGDLHWEHLDGRYGLGGLVHGTLASFRAGAVKPQAAIFREAERQLPRHALRFAASTSGCPPAISRSANDSDPPPRR